MSLYTNVSSSLGIGLMTDSSSAITQTPSLGKRVRAMDRLTEVPSKSQMKPAIVSIEGITGAGKTALLELLEQQYESSTDVVVLREPSEAWESITWDGMNLLDLYYYDRNTYGFAFQLLYFLAVERQLQGAIRMHADKRVIICERSLLSAGVLSEMLRGKFQSEITYQVYQKLFEKEGVGYVHPPDQMIFLSPNPENCVGRISRKDFRGDEVITLRHLQDLRASIKELRGESTTGGFLEIYGSLSQENILEAVDRLIADQKQKSWTTRDLAPKRRPIVVSLEGNVGSGKSTLLEKIERIKDAAGVKDVVVMREPVEEWMRIREGSFLDSDPGVSQGRHSVIDFFYTQPERYALTFQALVAWTTMRNLYRILEENPDVELIVCERSLQSSFLVFEKMLRDAGTLNAVEHEVLKVLYNEEGTEWMKPLYSLYLETTAIECLSRIRNRDRKGEGNINLDWLERCRNYHEDMWARADVTMPQRILSPTETMGETDDLAKEIWEWCLRIRDKPQLYPSPPRNRDFAGKGAGGPTRKERDSLSSNSTSSSGSMDKSGTETGSSTESVMIKLKFKGVNVDVEVGEEIVTFDWLVCKSVETFPILESTNIALFTWINGNRIEEYATDDADLREAVAEMRKLGRKTYRFEIVNLEPIPLPLGYSARKKSHL